MEKVTTQTFINEGDAFAVPLEDGRFTVCRVVKRKDSGSVLVVNSDWIGRQLPPVNAPALRTTLHLTHHSWEGVPCAVWVDEAPPRNFVPIGSIPPLTSDGSIPDPGEGSWAFFRIQPLEQRHWNHPDEIPPPPPKPEGRFTLHRFNGDEVYRFENAVMFAYENDPGVTLWFEVESDSDAIQRCDDTVDMGMSPNAEVGIDLAELDVDKLVGREFLVSGTKTDDEDSCMSLLYYFEHEPLRDNRIAIVSRVADRFRIRWSAVVQDVNYYDGSKPPARVEIEGEFIFKDIALWSNR